MKLKVVQSYTSINSTLIQFASLAWACEGLWNVNKLYSIPSSQCQELGR